MTLDIAQGYNLGRGDPMHRKLIEPRQLTSTSGVICVEMVCLRWWMVVPLDSSQR